MAIDILLAGLNAAHKAGVEMKLFTLKNKFSLLKKQEELHLISYREALREQTEIAQAVKTVLEELVVKKPEKDKDEKAGRPAILFLGSNPLDTGKIQLEKEFVKIASSLQDGIVDFSLKAEWALKVGELQGALLKHKPVVVHFAGHGVEASKKFPDGGIILEDQDGNPKLVASRSLSTLFKILLTKIPIKVVVLNACYAATQARAIAKYVPYVIGMTDAVPDQTAIQFATGFYRGLGEYQDDIAFAFDLAVNQIELEGVGGTHLPVLYVNGALQKRETV